ncbi:MAG: ATP phosphoribosyltransferase [Sporichthyaceae bacterium]|nr:ATP phosphoribosyltransferase [Sporichthyaceae bacterium]
MLRVALPNKGMLAEPALRMLGEAGYRVTPDHRHLVVHDTDNGVEFLFLRPRDIAVYVGRGRLDVGITGRDMLCDSGAAAEEILRLGFGESTVRFAVPPGSASEVAQLSGRRVATAYPGLVGKYLADAGVAAEVIRLDGVVENAVRLGVADAVADVVSTGATLDAAGLRVIGDPILESEAVLIAPDRAERDELGQLVRRLQGVLVARQYVLMDYDITVDKVDAACAVTPGLESPTVSPLHEAGWVAVRAMVPRLDAQRIMDELWELGARAILVTAIHACRI